MIVCLHTLEEENGERGGDAINMSQRERTIDILPGGPETLKSSLMLGSVYSCIKEPLRKTPSKYRLQIRRKKSGIEDIGIGEGKGKFKGRDVPEKNSKTLGWRILRGGEQTLYKKCTAHGPCLVSNKGQTWKPTKAVIGWKQSQSVTTKRCGQHMAIR
jgi:hypothetical protein